MADITSSAAPIKTSRRHWWLAALLSLIAPGLGQVYAGAWKRAIALILALYLPQIPLALVLMLYVIPLWIAGIADAAYLCRREPQQHLRPYQRWYAILPLGIAIVALGDLASNLLPRTSNTKTFHTATLSMLPTLRGGDYFMVRTAPPGQHELRRGEIIVFRAADGRDYVQRLIGLPGDRIQIKDNLVKVNDIQIRHEPTDDMELSADSCADMPGPRYREIWPDKRNYPVCTLPHSSLSDFSAVVTEGEVFVLGDNRVNSADSRTRFIGTPPISSIVGTATYIYWSKDIRRIGNRLD
ncbi:MAG: signal peptidase I [Ferrovibrio sp.]|uniref:signal peptidase I n=1 Tax=Ferrovibrio sp. TaxID=1917215 RepID=UPI00391B16DF